jgi:hypothetical protein
MPDNTFPNPELSEGPILRTVNGISGANSAPSIRASNHSNHSSQGMDAFIFPKIFHTFLPEETRCLHFVYTKLGGELPSKRGLRALSSECGISQAKIRKWFAMQDELQPFSELHAPGSVHCPIKEVEQQQKEITDKELHDIHQANGAIHNLLLTLDTF